MMILSGAIGGGESATTSAQIDIGVLANQAFVASDMNDHLAVAVGQGHPLLEGGHLDLAAMSCR